MCCCCCVYVFLLFLKEWRSIALPWVRRDIASFLLVVREGVDQVGAFGVVPPIIVEAGILAVGIVGRDGFIVLTHNVTNDFNGPGHVHVGRGSHGRARTPTDSSGTQHQRGPGCRGQWSKSNSKNRKGSKDKSSNRLHGNVVCVCVCVCVVCVYTANERFSQ